MRKYSNIDIFNDVTRQHIPTSKEIIPFHNNSRLEVDTLINGKTQFQETNTVIKSLQEEIINLKDKLKLVYEKDKEIQELKCKIESYEKESLSFKQSLNELTMLKRQNKEMKDQLDIYRVTEMNIEALESENFMLKEKVVELYEKLHPDSDDEGIDKVVSHTNKSHDTNSMIQVDIEQLKDILSNRLKSYHQNHINELLLSYNLHERSEISKDDMVTLLSKAIHI